MDKNYRKFIVLVISAFTFFCCHKKNEDVTQYVNPFIGTAYNGHTFPGAALPFGFVQASPETGRTDWRYCSGYNYADSLILGFAQTHLNGTGCPDLGDILLFPYSGPAERKDFHSTFSHKTEKAEPGYYRVSLEDAGADVELTATSRTAFHKYTFRNEGAKILLDLQSGINRNDQYLQTHVIDSKINIENDHIISGYHRLSEWVNRDLYYTIEFDKPFRIEKELPRKRGEKSPRYILAFDIAKHESVLVKIALSTVSIEGAKANLKAENNQWNFSHIKKQACEKWNSLLSRVKVNGSRDQKESFYTSLYHLYLQPANIADADGRYRGANDSIYFSDKNEYYSTFSLWDTYRAAHPLYTILVPEKVSGFVNSMVAHQDAAGILPIWTLWGKENYCMIANHSIPVIVDAYLKGFKGFDPDKAYQAVKTTLTKSHLNSSWEIYDRFGYYPFDLVNVESVSRTVESAYDDYCAALFAKALGYDNDYRFFIQRSGYYKNLFDSTSKLMRGRDSQGKWREPFNSFLLSHASTAGGDYTEGNAWQYTWHVQHDVKGIISLMGGNDYFTKKLDSLFTIQSSTEGSGFVSDVTGLIGQYAHGNEPSHHVAYFYALAGKPWRTQELVRKITERFYVNKPDGLCGNDDCGQMSAWYIFSAMGFYPVDPVSGNYVLGAPQVNSLEITLPGNKTFTMEARNLSKENKYVREILLNDKPYANLSISHRDIMKGGKLVFEMGTEKRE